METGAIGAWIDLLNTQVRKVFGIEQVVAASGNQAVSHTSYVVEEIPHRAGAGSIRLFAHRTQRQRPAIALGSGGGSRAVALVGTGTRIGQGQLRCEAPWARSNLQGIAVGELPIIALH